MLESKEFNALNFNENAQRNVLGRINDKKRKQVWKYSWLPKIASVAFVLLVSISGGLFILNESDEPNQQTDEKLQEVLMQDPKLKSYIEEAYDTLPDLGAKDYVYKNGNADEKEAIINYSNDVLASLVIIKEIGNYEKVLKNNNFISAKYRAGFNYFILPDVEKPHEQIYIGTKDNKRYLVKADKNAVGTLVNWMNGHRPVNDLIWKDVTQLDEDAKYDFPTDVNDYIASANRSFHETPDEDSKLIQAGFDEMYYYYLESLGLENVLAIFKVEGVAIEKDFENLRSLAKIVSEEQLTRSDGVSRDYGKNKRDAVKNWHEPSERMKKAVDYLQKLLNDLDAAINKDGKGEIFGYSYQAEGNKTEELEQFINQKE